MRPDKAGTAPSATSRRDGSLAGQPEHWQGAFRDVDRSQAAVGNAFYPHSVDLRGRTRTTFACDLDAYRAGPLVIGRLAYAVDMRLDCPYVGGYHINVPVRGALDSRSGRSDLRVLPGTAALYEKHVSAVLGTAEREGFGMIAIKIDESALERSLEQLLARRVRGTIRLAPTLDLADGWGQQWWQITAGFLRQVSQGGLFGHPLVAQPAVESVLHGLLLAAGHQYTDELLSTRASTPAGLRRAQEFIHDRLHEPIGLSDVARTTGMSVRAVQRGFQEHLGTTFTRYLRDRRLERAHADLVAGDPGRLGVGEVAIRWGFPHHGRFAAEYRRRYGRSPSETLRSGPG